jgi:hypothetical protein
MLPGKVLSPRPELWRNVASEGSESQGDRGQVSVFQFLNESEGAWRDGPAKLI